MANLNRTECNCTGIWNPTTSICDTPQAGEDPCPPTWFETAGTWDWNNISNQALTWGYALGWFKSPDATNMQTEAYMQELARQKQQMMMYMIGLGILMVVLVIVVIKKK